MSVFAQADAESAVGLDLSLPQPILACVGLLSPAFP